MQQQEGYDPPAYMAYIDTNAVSEDYQRGRKEENSAHGCPSYQTAVQPVGAARYSVRCCANSSADRRLAAMSFSNVASTRLISARRSSWDFSVSR
jgi:hypothetical protein